MIEFIRHSFGLCGETFHPSVLLISINEFGLYLPYNYIKYKITSLCKK